MTNQLWLRLRSVLLLWVCFGATTFAPPTIFAYDGQNQTTVANDRSGKSAIGYDAACLLARGEKKSRTTGDRVSFAKFAELLAAKTTPKINNLADDILDWVGPKSTLQKPPGGSDLILRSADGTKQIRFDLTNPHGLQPHVNVGAGSDQNKQ